MESPFKGSVYCSSYIEMCTKLPLKYGHLSNEDSVYCPSYIEMCTKLPLKKDTSLMRTVSTVPAT